jgi:hypothetical protein
LFQDSLFSAIAVQSRLCPGWPVGPGWSGNKLQLNTIQYNTVHTIRKLLFARTARKHKLAYNRGSSSYDHLSLCPTEWMIMRNTAGGLRAVHWGLLALVLMRLMCRHAGGPLFTPSKANTEWSVSVHLNTSGSCVSSGVWRAVSITTTTVCRAVCDGAQAFLAPWAQTLNPRGQTRVLWRERGRRRANGPLPPCMLRCTI